MVAQPDDADALDETAEILGDSRALHELAKAEAAIKAGDVVRGVEAVRRLRDP